MLPKIDLPIYDLIIPSSGKKIQVRPFTVKEEKLLLLALESGEESITNTTLQIVNNCILTEGIDIEKLPFFDIDYLFIALRAKSVGDTVEVNYECKADTETGEPCNHVFPVNIDISNVSLTKKDNIKDMIDIGGNKTLKMEYPSYTVMKSLTDLNDNITNKVRLIAQCIVRVFDGDKVYSKKDFTPKEMEAFIESLTQAQFKKLEEFVENFPGFSINANNIKCPNCGYMHNLVFDDYTRFFE